MTTQGRKPPNLQIPDLVIEPTEPRPTRRERIVHVPNQASCALELGGYSSGSGGELPSLDLDQFIHGNDLDLELNVAPKTEGAPAGAKEMWPSASTPDVQHLEIEAGQMQRATPYGEPPAHWFETPLYAWRVYRGQLQLKQEITRARALLDQAEQDRDAVLAVWIDGIRPMLLGDDRWVRMLEPLNAEAAGLKQAVDDLERLKGDVNRGQQILDESEGQLKSQLERATRACAAQSDQLANLERTLAREQAKRKRIDIEARAVGTAAFDASDASALQSRMANADLAVQQACEELERQRRGLGVAQRARDALQLELRRCEDRRKHTTRNGQQLTYAAERGVSATAQSLERKKADIGRAVLALREPKYVARATHDELQARDDEILRLATEYACLTRALSGFDRQAVRRGLWLSIATLGLGLLLLGASIIL